MEILIFSVGILVGVMIMIFVSGSLFDSHYTGGHAAGRVHHKRSWEE